MYTADLKVYCIEKEEEFKALKKEWKALFDACVDVSPFNSWEWLFSWWQSFGKTYKLKLLVLRKNDDGRIVGLAPMYMVAKKKFHFKCNLLRLVGDGSNDSDYLQFIIDPKYFSPCLEKIGLWFRNSGEWDVIELRGINSNSMFAKYLYILIRESKEKFRYDLSSFGKCTLPSNFKMFISARQSRFRTKIRSLLRKFEQNDNLYFDVNKNSDELYTLLPSLFLLHQRRWQHFSELGVFGSMEKRKFYSLFTNLFAVNDWLRIYSLRYQNRYLAHQLCFRDKSVTYLLQEGFDMTDSKASYGQMLRALVFRHLIENKEKTYDFLGGYTKHKSDWGALEFKLLNVILVGKSLRGRIYFYFPIIKEKIAYIAKNKLPTSAINLIKKLIKD